MSYLYVSQVGDWQYHGTINLGDLGHISTSKACQLLGIYHIYLILCSVGCKWLLENFSKS